MLAPERAEDDDAVEPVQELGPERARRRPLDAAAARTRPAARRSRRPGRSAIAEPRFEVRMITQWRKSTVRPC